MLLVGMVVYSRVEYAMAALVIAVRPMRYMVLYATAQLLIAVTTLSLVRVPAVIIGQQRGSYAIGGRCGQLPQTRLPYERKADHFLAFATIAALLVCHRRLTKIST
jgi:hypothetical protein